MHKFSTRHPFDHELVQGVEKKNTPLKKSNKFGNIPNLRAEGFFYEKVLEFNGSGIAQLFLSLSFSPFL